MTKAHNPEGFRVRSPSIERICATRLLRAGLVGVRELGLASGISEYTVRSWTRSHSIDVGAARAAYFADWWRSYLPALPERDRITGARASGNATVSDLADVLGTSTTQVHRWTKGVPSGREAWCRQLWLLALAKVQGEFADAAWAQEKQADEEKGRYLVYNGQTLDTWRGVWVGKLNRRK